MCGTSKAAMPDEAQPWKTSQPGNAAEMLVDLDPEGEGKGTPACPLPQGAATPAAPQKPTQDLAPLLFSEADHPSA